MAAEGAVVEVVVEVVAGVVVVVVVEAEGHLVHRLEEVGEEEVLAKKTS